MGPIEIKEATGTGPAVAVVHALASPSNAITNFCNSNTKVSPFTTLSVAFLSPS